MDDVNCTGNEPRTTGKMFKRSKVKSTTGISEDRRRKSAAADNLYVSPSFVGKFQKFAARKQKSYFSKSTSNTAENESSGSSKLAKEVKLTSNVPKNAAVHFGNFYGVRGSVNKPEAGKTNSFAESGGLSFNKAGPRLEFTRQMVHKLERTAGTEEYARQVSALLEETVEPPHFKLHSLPTENSIPDGRHNPSGYPLWYKEPYKMPFTSDEIYKLLKEKFDNASKRAKDVFDEEDISEKDSCEEFSDEEEAEEDEQSHDLVESLSVNKEESFLNTVFSGSSSGTEAKDTDSKDSVSVNTDTQKRM